jgi:DNA-binding response OmpR family regulator
MKLLVVEDESRMAQLLRRGLTEEGHEVTCATDGVEGLRAVQHDQFDAIILDVMMPRLDGFEVAQNLRASRNLTPLLMLTAKDSETDIVKGLDLGADDYLTKPFSFGELLARLHSVTRRARTGVDGKLAFADLVLDPVRHEVVRDGVKIWLTRREYSLLEMLMRHSGQIVSRSALIESVWGTNHEVEENTLDAFVHLLRNKIDLPGLTKLIHTVRGAGYSIRKDVCS